MSTRQLLISGLLAALGLIMLLGVVVFLGEPQPVGGQAPQFRGVDAAYLAAPFLLMAAAAFAPLRALLRYRRRMEM
jgi:hypothetical protein